MNETELKEFVSKKERSETIGSVRGSDSREEEQEQLLRKEREKEEDLAKEAEEERLKMEAMIRLEKKKQEKTAGGNRKIRQFRVLSCILIFYLIVFIPIAFTFKQEKRYTFTANNNLTHLNITVDTCRIWVQQDPLLLPGFNKSPLPSYLISFSFHSQPNTCLFYRYF
jgi:hypothetical protein